MCASRKTIFTVPPLNMVCKNLIQATIYWTVTYGLLFISTHKQTAAAASIACMLSLKPVRVKQWSDMQHTVESLHNVNIQLQQAQKISSSRNSFWVLLSLLKDREHPQYLSELLELFFLILVINQLDAQNLFYNKFISCLYMFRAPCAHRQEVKIVLCSLWYHHAYR